LILLINIQKTKTTKNWKIEKKSDVFLISLVFSLTLLTQNESANNEANHKKKEKNNI
jgi:uncharacterized membrane protein